MIRTTTTAIALLLAASAAVIAAASASADVQPVQSQVEAQQLDKGQAQPGEIAKRKKKRVPGGSGCDSTHDAIEHPECL
jgi:hypothetical protein